MELKDYLKDLSFDQVVEVLKGKREKLASIKTEVEKSLYAIEHTLKTLKGIKPAKTTKASAAAGAVKTPGKRGRKPNADKVNTATTKPAAKRGRKPKVAAAVAPKATVAKTAKTAKTSKATKMLKTAKAPKAKAVKAAKPAVTKGRKPKAAARAPRVKNDVPFKDMIRDVLKAQPLMPQSITDNIVKQYNTDIAKTKKNVGALLTALVKSGDISKSKEGKKSVYQLVAGK